MAFGKFGRYHPDGVEVRAERFDLVAELRDDLRLAAANGRVRLDTTLGACEVVTDRDHVRHVVVNLLQNALKYSPPESEVVLALEADGREARLRVTDRGIGIPPGEVEALFSPFYRAANVASAPGSGLGLAIVKKAASLIGARVSVDTELGRGTTFTVVLPVVAGVAA